MVGQPEKDTTVDFEAGQDTSRVWVTERVPDWDTELEGEESSELLGVKDAKELLLPLELMEEEVEVVGEKEG